LNNSIDIVSVASRQSDLLLGVSELLVAAANRWEAVGLLPGTQPEADQERLAHVMKAVDRGDAGLLVAVDHAGRVVGSVQWQRSGYATRRVMAEIQKMCITPSARGLGLGKLLLERAAADAAAAGVELLTLDVRGNNRAAIAMYEDCGFARVGVWPNGVADGEVRHDVVMMARQLARAPEARLLGSLPIGAGHSMLRGERHTKRLILCRPSVDDMSGLAVTSALIQMCDRHWATAALGYWTVRDSTDARLLGFGGVRPSSTPGGELRLFCRLLPSAQGHGYAEELGRAALDLAASREPGAHVVASIRSDNVAAWRVAERLGFSAEATDGPRRRYVLKLS
jgi:RimJ/RimL family protein N-acetyltransferase